MPKSQSCGQFQETRLKVLHTDWRQVTVYPRSAYTGRRAPPPHGPVLVVPMSEADEGPPCRQEVQPGGRYWTPSLLRM